MSSTEVIKHSASAQIANVVPLFARRLWNVLLARAYDDLPDQSVVVHRVAVSDVLDTLAVTTRNSNHLRELLRVLVGTAVEWNVLGKDRTEEWTVASMLGGARIRQGVLEYHFSNFLRERLHNPKIFVRISLSIQNRFDSKHSLALYELAVDYLDLKRGRGETPWIQTDDFRLLMGLTNEYPRFSQLNQRVITPAVKEVNKESDVRVEVRYRKVGQAVDAVKFAVEPASPGVSPKGGRGAAPLPLASRRRVGGPLPRPARGVAALDISRDAFERWYEELSDEQRGYARSRVAATLTPTDREALARAEAAGRIAPTVEVNLLIRLRDFWAGGAFAGGVTPPQLDLALTPAAAEAA